MFRNLEGAPVESHHERLVKDKIVFTNWSTDLRTPVMERSFLSSTVTRWSVSVLNTEKMSLVHMSDWRTKDGCELTIIYDRWWWCPRKWVVIALIPD